MRNGTSPRPLVAIVAAAALLVAVGCGDDDDAGVLDADASDATIEPGDGDETPPSGGQLRVESSELGDVLADPDGLTLYIFTDDTDGESTCVDEGCETAWPPVPGDVGVPGEVAALGFGTVDRPDRSTQLRIGDRPLYTFGGDSGPGDVNGHESGGVWFAVGSDGAVIGLDDEPDPDETDDTDAAPETTEDTAPVEPVDTELGPVLTDVDGFTVYVFLRDEPGVSDCFAPCSETWPPVEAGTELEPRPDADRLGILEREDGISQITLDDQPLYTYVDDESPGDVNGHEELDVWFAVGADGTVLLPPAVSIGSTDVGNVLIDPDGFTVYVFANDEPGASTCDGDCAVTWPPVPGDTLVADALDVDQFDLVARGDGTSQLALRGQPLYTFSGDDNPGDARGTEIDNWDAVTADQIALAGTDRGDPDGDDGEPGASDDGETTPPAGAYDIEVVDTELGEVLAYNGLTLYGFTPDTPDEPTCYGGCADAWPPVTGDVTVAPDIESGPGAQWIDRDDGPHQLVIGNWPAYTFSGDTAPGDLSGQGSGDEWFAIAPDGTLIGA